jgi:two-component system NtrC family response regulator
MSEKRRTLLIVEDDPALQKQMRWAFDQYETVVANNREERDCPVASARARRGHDGSRSAAVSRRCDRGFPLLGEILALAPDTKVVVLTGQHDRENAVRRWAWAPTTSLPKPFEPELLSLTLDRAASL